MTYTVELHLCSVALLADRFALTHPGGTANFTEYGQVAGEDDHRRQQNTEDADQNNVQTATCLS